MKLRMLRWGDYPRFSRWALNAMICIFIRERQRGRFDAHGRRKGEDRAERNLKILALWRVTQPQVKHFWQPSETRRDKVHIPP